MKIVLTLTLFLLLTALVPAQEKLKQAADLYRAGNYNQAVTELEKLNSSDEGNYQSYLYLGAAYARLGKDKEARAAFVRAKNLKIVKNIDGEDPVKFIKIKHPNAKGTPDGFQSGTTILAVEFKSDKTVGLTFVVQSTTKELIINCVEAAKAIKFDPAKYKGVPISVIKLLDYAFHY